MRISHSLTPPGGWIYEEDGIIVYGQTWDELLTNVINHRVSNGKELGRPDDEIEDQIAEKFPYLIIGDGCFAKKK